MPRFWLTRREARETDRTTAHRQRITDYRTTFGSEAGQRVLADIAQRAGLMQPAFGLDGPDASAWRDGRRCIALEIIETINADPAAVLAAGTSGETKELFT